MLSLNIFGRSRKHTTVTILVFFVLLGLVVTHWVRPTYRTVEYAAFETHLRAPEDVSVFCAAHKFPPVEPLPPMTDLTNPPKQRRVYDLFLLNNEMDWLEVRLNTLYPFVDYFVIVEAEKTFTGLPKPLRLREQWSRYEDFHRKIIYLNVEDKVNSTLTWDHEDAYRNALLHEFVPAVEGTEQAPRYGDALILSDLDEMPRPETIKVLRYCDYPDRLTLRSHFYYYSFQWLHRGEQWPHPQATVYRGLEDTISPTNLRNGDGGQAESRLGPLQRMRQKADLYDAGFSCSWCFRTIKEMQTKMESSSHTPWNTEENRDAKTIVERVRNGTDIFLREGQIYDKVEGNLDVPKYVLDHWQDYRYLLDRDGEDAGFEDAKDILGSPS